MILDCKDLENIQYVEGKDDCYGSIRGFFRKHYELVLSNYARPFGFALNDLNLISDNMYREGFEPVNVPLKRLELGDVIVLAITGSSLANHLGVYVGNNYFLHHLYKRKSAVEDYGRLWQKQTLNIIRHPKVTEVNNSRPVEIVKLIDLMPPHVRHKIFG